MPIDERSSYQNSRALHDFLCILPKYIFVSFCQARPQVTPTEHGDSISHQNSFNSMFWFYSLKITPYLFWLVPENHVRRLCNTYAMKLGHARDTRPKKLYLLYYEEKRLYTHTALLWKRLLVQYCCKKGYLPVQYHCKKCYILEQDLLKMVLCSEIWREYAKMLKRYGWNGEEILSNHYPNIHFISQMTYKFFLIFSDITDFPLIFRLTFSFDLFIHIPLYSYMLNKPGS